jgi:hypothetical protein
MEDRRNIRAQMCAEGHPQRENLAGLGLCTHPEISQLLRLIEPRSGPRLCEAQRLRPRKVACRKIGLASRSLLLRLTEPRSGPRLCEAQRVASQGGVWKNSAHSAHFGFFPAATSDRLRLPRRRLAAFPSAADNDTWWSSEHSRAARGISNLAIRPVQPD